MKEPLARRKNRGSFGRRAVYLLVALLLVKLGAALIAGGKDGKGEIAVPAAAQEATSPDEIPARDEMPVREIEPGGLDLEIIEDVEKRAKELDSREEELKRREARLEAMREDLDRQIAELRAIQAKIEESISLRGDLEKKAVNKLAKTYASMPPENAAVLIQQIDRSIAVRVIESMKERAAGKILAAAPPEVASSLSEELVKRKREAGTAGGAR
ncbi:MAG: MotE family protein [Candidatus Nitrospinota bacterium M3_3B_026]